MKPAPLFEAPNRGLLLDVVVFGVNLIGMPLLMNSFVGLVRRAAADDPVATTALFGGSVGLLVLAPLGATLKRWHYHQRLGGRKAALGFDQLRGCLFNPIFYFCLASVIFAVVNAFIMQQVFGNREPGELVFVSSVFLGLGLIILHTYLVYRYFSPPRSPPTSVFLRGPTSEIIGDACLFTNMLLFQLIWNMLTFAGLGPPSGVVDVVGRLLVLCFLALLLYFPPRMFYLAEDVGRGRTWVMILVANAPVVVRVLLGSSVGVGG